MFRRVLDLVSSALVAYSVYYYLVRSLIPQREYLLNLNRQFQVPQFGDVVPLGTATVYAYLTIISLVH